MHGSFGNPAVVATEIDGQFRPGADKIVRRIFGDVCRVIWPRNTDAHLASIAGTNVRTARRWLSGEFEAPGVVLAAIIVEITKRN